MKRLSTSIFFIFASSSIFAASFDCAKATTPVEKLICANADLSGLDEQLAKAFNPTGKHNQISDFEREVQRAWLKQRNKCADAACLQSSYTARLRELRMQPLNDADTVTGKYSFGKGEGYQGYASVVLLAPDRLRYAIDITSGAPAWHTGEANGEAKLQDNVARTIPGTSDCKLILTFKDAKLTTSYGKGNTGSACATGAGVSLDGTFTKPEKSPKK